MPLYRVAPTSQLPHTIDLIQRQSAPRFANEVERDQQYPDPELGALAVVNTTVEVFNGTGWIPVGGGQPTLINNLQDVDARFPPDGAVLTWSSAALAWGWSMPAVPTPDCIPWSDNFERADGPIGPDWILALGTSYGSFTIDDGAAIAPMDVVPGSRMYWHEPQSQPGGQFIEVEVENMTDNLGWLQLITNANLTDRACQGVEVLADAGELEVYTFSQVATGGYGPPLDDVYIPMPSEPFRLALRSDADGRQRVYVDDELVIDGVEPTPVTGDYVGMWMDPSTPYTSPRILSVTGGCPPTE